MPTHHSLDPTTPAGAREHTEPDCTLSLEARLRLFGDDAVLTPDEFAAMRGCSPRTLERERASGKGAPFLQLSSKRVGYLLRDCKQFLRHRRVGAGAEMAA